MNLSAVGFDNPPCDRQPQADTADAADVSAAAKRLEDPIAIGRVNADAVIGDRELRRRSVVHERDLHLTGIGRIFHGVAQQIVENLLDADDVAANRNGAVRE